MSSSIQHKGTIVGIVGDRIDVRMTVESACSSCRVKSMCGVSENEERIISVENPVLSRVCCVGEDVVVSISEGVGLKAVVYSYILPFFIMVAVLVTLALVQNNELVTGLSALGSCAVYYAVLFLFRDKIEKEIEFKVDKLID